MISEATYLYFASPAFISTLLTTLLNFSQLHKAQREESGLIETDLQNQIKIKVNDHTFSINLAMDDQDEDNCTATNLSTYDNVELRGIVSKVVTTAAGDALILFPRFQKLVRDHNTSKYLSILLEYTQGVIIAYLLSIFIPILSL